jgi:DNA end-binding protein Ku
MARSIWSGAISFGLLHIPVQVMTAESPTEISLRMLDRRNHAPIQFKRVNAETGKEVEWKDVVKAYEVEKGEFVPLEPEDIKRAAPEAAQTIEIERFVERNAISAMYFDKPYYLTPGKKAEKGYVLLREVLEKTGRVGIARVVLRTKEYLCAVMPEGDALVLDLLRWPEEIVDASSVGVPAGKPEDYRINARELEMAKQLIDAMEGEFAPEDFKDTFHDKLAQVIDEKMKKGGKRTSPAIEKQPATTNVVDFMALLKQSLEKSGEGRKPARAAKARRSPAKKATPRRKRSA